MTQWFTIYLVFVGTTWAAGVPCRLLSNLEANQMRLAIDAWGWGPRVVTNRRETMIRKRDRSRSARNGAERSEAERFAAV